MLASWCVDAAEKLLRLGLRNDYVNVTDFTDVIQGRLLAIETSLANSAGRLTAFCEFQEFSDDTPLNRVIKAACNRIARYPGISPATKKRARNVAYRMDTVGPIRPTDVKARIDRLDSRYTKAFTIAVLILASFGLSANAGPKFGFGFLVRTPELVEDGLRTILREGLVDIDVTKRKLQLGDSGLSINPDLIFGDAVAIGDVKYRRLTNTWKRPDLYQVTSFATGFHCSSAAIIGFASETATLPKPLKIGVVCTTAFAWDIRNQSDPERSAAKLIDQVGSWIRHLTKATSPRFD